MIFISRSLVNIKSEVFRDWKEYFLAVGKQNTRFGTILPIPHPEIINDLTLQKVRYI